MYMNGVVIGMAVIHRHHKLILPDRHLALTACFVVVGGAGLRSSAGCRIAATLLPTTAASISVSAWCVQVYRFGLFTSISKLKRYSLNKQGNLKPGEKSEYPPK